MRETTIEKTLILEVSKTGGWALKLSAAFVIGLPDRLVLHKGRAFFVELKAPNKKPRKSQTYIHKKLARLGFPVLVIDSREAVALFIDTLKLL